VLNKDFPHLDTRRARVVLVEATDRLLGAFDPTLSENARTTLEKRGVEVLVETAVDEVTPTSVRLADGREIAAATMIWTAGVRAHPLAETMGVELTKAGRVVTLPDLSIPGRPEVFVVGDLAGTEDSDGRLLPQVAPVAIQGARHAAEQIRRSLRGDSTTPFRYVDKGSMATIGRRDAVAQLPGGLRFTGTVGWLAWLALHLVMLIGFRNRANVLVNWAWNSLTYDRGSLIISGADVVELVHDEP
jgi:NADH dehydrogenase